VDEIAPEFEPTTAERIARNDALFREANERIREKAEEYEVQITVPFICECADPMCRDIVRLGLDEYREIRRNPRYFLNIPGHESVAGGNIEVVDRRDGHLVVEKIGRAGEVAEALDRRTPKEMS
jgi:hypothetical protein